MADTVGSVPVGWSLLVCCMFFCPSRVDPSQLKSGLTLSMRSRPLDLSLSPGGCSQLVSNLLIWDGCQSAAFILMLLGSSGPANARYLSAGTTPALIKLCAPVSPLRVSDRSISAAFMSEHLRCPGTDYRIWFPTYFATQVSHADTSRDSCFSMGWLLTASPTSLYKLMSHRIV